MTLRYEKSKLKENKARR